VLVIQATATGRETRLSKIVELVEQASLDKPEIVQWANRIGGYFVVTVIGLAVITLFAWLWIDAAVAVDRAVALLIVACPCALALATPLAISVALGRAANRKIMIKGGDVLQQLTRRGMIWLDKTGTLTEGRLEVVRWYGDTNWQPLVAALETKASHPVAAAIVEFANRECQLELRYCQDAVEEVNQQFGLGISGQIYDRELHVGNAKLLLANNIPIWRRHQQIADRILKQNLAPCWIAADGKVVGILALGDAIRPETRSAIDHLTARGWTIGILSGDHERIVAEVATRLGIPQSLALGGRSPEEKVQCVSDSFADYETVVMVGDGVNDSAALAAASVGIAVHKSAEASLAAAPVYLAEEGLEPIVELLEISKSTGNTIRKNFAVSISYNLFGATFAALGLINPLIAAILMPISSLTVVVISLTAGRQRSKFEI
jgi:Cu2+-exporting ATPase